MTRHHPSRPAPRSRCGAFLAVALGLAAPATAQWKINPAVDDAIHSWDPDFVDAVRFEMDACAFVLQVEDGAVRIQRTDIGGIGYHMSPEYWSDVISPWPKAVWFPVKELVGCKIAPHDFVLAYTVLNAGNGVPNLRVARIQWNSGNDTFTTAAGFPVTLSTESGPHDLAITPRDVGAGVIDGVLVAWHTTIGGVTKIRQQGVTGAGSLLWSSFTNGVLLETGDLGTASDVIQTPTIVSTEDGLAMTTYHKKVAGKLKHWTAKLDANANGTTFQYGTPIEVPGQLLSSTTRCCVCSAGNGGAMYGFATDDGTSSGTGANTRLVRAEVSGALVEGLSFWDSDDDGSSGGADDRLRALSYLDLPGQAGLLVYRDESGVRAIKWASGTSGWASFLWTHHVRGASRDNDDDAATVTDGTHACVMVTSDEQVTLESFHATDATGTENWELRVNDLLPAKWVNAYGPKWPHVFAVGPNHTPGFMMAWYDEGYFLAERVGTTGKMGRYLVGPGLVPLDLAASALSFDTVSPDWRYLDVVQLELADMAGLAGDVEIHVANGTSRVGIEQNPAAWTLVATAPVVSAGPGKLTDVVLPAPVALPPGTNAVMLRSPSLRLSSSPAVGGLQTFDLGSGTSVVCGAHVANWPAGPLHNGRVLVGAFSLDELANPTVPAAHTSYGAGCYALSDSFYADYADAAAAATALDGQSMTMIPTGTGQYFVSWGGGGLYPPGLPLPPSAFSPNADDGVATFVLPSPVMGTTTIHVHTNGGVWAGNNLPSLAPNDYTPNAASLLNAPFEGFWCWHDFNVTEPGSGQISIWLDASGGPGTEKLIVTWSDVESYPLGVNNRSTIQFQLDLLTGIATWVWQHVDGNVDSPYGSGYVVGWSPGGSSVDGGSLDLATALPIQTTVNMLPLALAAAPAPIAGTMFTYTTTNLPEVAPGAGVYLGFTFISLTGSAMPGGGLDLAFLGAPGCPFHVQTLDIVLPFSGASPTQAVNISLPSNTPAGFTFHAQSASLFTPGTLPNGLNSLGATFSNGVASRVGI